MTPMIKRKVPEVQQNIDLDKLFEGLTEEERKQKVDELEGSYQNAFMEYLKNMSELERKNFITNKLRNGKTYINKAPKISRNDKCFCGSGKKYKNCCMREITEYSNFKEYYDYMKELNEELHRIKEEEKNKENNDGNKETT